MFMERVIKVLGEKKTELHEVRKGSLQGVLPELKGKGEIVGLAIIPCVPCEGTCAPDPCTRCYCSGHIDEVEYA